MKQHTYFTLGILLGLGTVLYFWISRDVKNAARKSLDYESHNDKKLRRKKNMEIEKKLKVPNWYQYFVNDMDYYSSTDRRDLICRFKLRQVYQNFLIARMNCILAKEKIKLRDLGQNVVENFFLQNAIIYYNSCIDLSWQLIYFQYMPKEKVKFNITNEEMEEIEKKIKLKSLEKLLKEKSEDEKERKEKEKISQIVTEFSYKKIPKRFRDDYHYIKHRGTFDIFEVETETDSLFVVNGKKPDITIFRLKEFDSEGYIDMLLDFHNVFIEYMETLIEIIIKPKIRPSKYSFDEVLQVLVDNTDGINGVISKNK